MIRPFLIDLNPVELKYYSFMISLYKFNRRCDDLSMRICILIKKKDVNANVFNMIATRSEVKTLIKIFHVIANA